jgi:hypothetical protein
MKWLFYKKGYVELRDEEVVEYFAWLHYPFHGGHEERTH